MRRESEFPPRGPLRGPWGCPLDGRREREVPRHRQEDAFLPGPCPRSPADSSSSKTSTPQHHKPPSTHSIRLVGGRFFTHRFYVRCITESVHSSPGGDQQWMGPCGFAPEATPLEYICTTNDASYQQETGELSWTASSNSLPKPSPMTS